MDQLVFPLRYPLNVPSLSLVGVNFRKMILTILSNPVIFFIFMHDERLDLEDMPSGSKWPEMTPIPYNDAPWNLPGQQPTPFVPEGGAWGQPPGGNMMPLHSAGGLGKFFLTLLYNFF